jgi:hypothetical protein
VSTSRRLQAAKLRVVGAALASVLLVGGCAAGTHPGAAAVVGSTEISVTDVDKTSRAVSTVLGEPFTAAATLNELVRSALAEQIADQRSITVNDSEIAAAMLAVVGGDRTTYDRFVKDPVANDFLRDLAKGAVGTIKLGGGTGITDPKVQEAQQAGQAIIKDAAKNINVDIAPRFGKWSDGTIAGVSGSLSDESEKAKQKREAAEKQAQQQGQSQG